MRINFKNLLGIQSKTTKVRIMIYVLLPIVTVYAAVSGYLYAFQRDFVFDTEGTLSSPAENGLENVRIEMPSMSDGTKVLVWRAEPTVNGAPTILYLHGNAGTISRRSNRFKQILDSGFGLYVPAYRGYPGSEGSATETLVISDALEHFDRIKESTDNIVLFGESLGSNVGTAVALEREAKAFILEAPNTAIVDIAHAQYPFLPVPLMLKDQFLTRERIDKVTEPLLIVHGEDDSYVHPRHGRKLYELATEPKELYIIKDATHSNLWDTGIWSVVLAFLEKQSIY